MPYSQGDAVREPDGPARLRHRPDLGAALHPAGGAAGPGELGYQEVRSNFRLQMSPEQMSVACPDTDVFLPSDVLYPKNTCSAHSGVPAEVLCRGRDFVVSWRPCFFCSFIKLSRIKSVTCLCLSSVVILKLGLSCCKTVICFSLSDVEVHSGALCDEKGDCIYHQSMDQYDLKNTFSLTLRSHISGMVIKKKQHRIFGWLLFSWCLVVLRCL